MRKNPLPPTLKLRRTCRLSKLSHLPFAAYPSTHIWIAFFTLLKSTKRICSQDDCTAPDRYRGTPALLGLGLSLIHKSESREVSNQWLLPLPREGGSRSTFDKLRAGETEGFSAQPEHYLAARRKSPRIPLRLGRPSHPKGISPPPLRSISFYISLDRQNNAISAHALHFQHSWRPLILLRPRFISFISLRRGSEASPADLRRLFYAYDWIATPRFISFPVTIFAGTLRFGFFNHPLR